MKKEADMNGVLEEAGIRAERNSSENLGYYAGLEDFLSGETISEILKMSSFAVYTPRQVITDFLVRIDLFRMILEVPGSIVECGVFNGQGLMTFAQASAILEPNNLSRMLYGFDTFEGFRGVSPEDARGNSGFLKEGGMGLDSFERLNRAIKLYDRNRFIGHVEKVRLVKGDIMETLDPFLEANPHLLVALLYLDLDLYKPTRHVLERLIDRVPKGGIIAFDQLAHPEFPGETLALLHTLGAGKLELRRFQYSSRISYFIR